MRTTFIVNTAALNSAVSNSELSQAELCQRAKINPSTLTRLLNGKSKECRAKTARELARHLNVKMTAIAVRKKVNQ